MSRLSGPMPAACRQIGVVGMKISTKGRYALLLMGDLARAQKGELTPIKEIANHLGFCNLAFFGSFVRHHFGVSPKYLRCKYLAETPIKSKD